MAARTTIVIVSYNTRDLLRGCLESLRDHVLGVPVIVVDNASRDGSAAMVAQEFPEVRLVENPSNVGFGTANNRALAEVSTELAFLLNSDTRLEADVVSALAATLDASPGAAIVGCKLILPDGRVQRSARRFPSAWRSLCNAIALADLIPTVVTAVDYVDGAAMLVRMDAMREIGGFDEQFFLYVEDADLCRRVHDRGWRVLYDPRVAVVHLGGASTTRGSARDDRLRWEGLARYAAIHLGAVHYGAFVCARALELIRQVASGGMRWILLDDKEGRQNSRSAARYLRWHWEFIRPRRG
ncbi:MAG TPA: glycosyltransferase family 2 protein [Candidatus Binatia bacterium]|nr:glycosyltransferase family 2 protein [Candidatus Binatia bacterium]